jgi:hypothetical protein
MLRIRGKVCLIVGLLLLSTVWVDAQTGYGSIIERVTDDHGSRVPGAKVSLRRRPEKDVFVTYRETGTNNDGAYAFSIVPLGIYEVQVTIAGFARALNKRIELTSTQPTTVDATFQFAPCSDEQEVPSAEQLPVADHARIESTLVGILIGEPKRNVMLLSDNFSPDWLQPEQRAYATVLTGTAIKDLTEKNGSQRYYSFTKPIVRGHCVGITVFNNLTVKGQLEDASMGGGTATYEFRKVDGIWTWLLLYSTIS